MSDFDAGVAGPGNTLNAQLMAQARESLRGAWGTAIGGLLLYLVVSGVAGAIPFVGPIIGLVIGGPFTLGLSILWLAIARRQGARATQIFDGFQKFGTAFGAYILMAIFVSLWTLLLIVPGIIAAFSYAMTWYIIADDPSVGALEAIGRSKRMMRGYKGKLFCLGLRFIGWYLLCLLTCGIGFLWFAPYVGVSFVKFYEDIAGQAEPVQAADAAPSREF